MSNFPPPAVLRRTETYYDSDDFVSPPPVLRPPLLRRTDSIMPSMYDEGYNYDSNDFVPPPVLRPPVLRRTDSIMPPPVLRRPVLRRTDSIRPSMYDERYNQELKRKIMNDYRFLEMLGFNLQRPSEDFNILESILRSRGVAGARELNRIKEDIINSYERVRNNFIDDSNLQHVIDELLAIIPRIDSAIDMIYDETNNDFPPSPAHPPVLEPANNYENKYLKYKQKYLELKKKMK